MSSSKMHRLLCPILAIGLFGADWPQLRGPNGSGLCPGCGQLPVEFGPQTNVLWKTDLPKGSLPRFWRAIVSSSPVRKAMIWSRCASPAALARFCGGARSGARGVRPGTPLNHRAAPTAVTDGRSVFVFFADFGLLAYDLDGTPRWQLPLGPFNSQHGIVASPVYADGKVVLVCDQDTDAFILAVNAETGRIAWRVPREVINGYSTPVVYRPPRGPSQIIAAGSYQLTAYSIVDGALLWFVRGLTCQPKSAPLSPVRPSTSAAGRRAMTRGSRWNCLLSPR